MSIRNSLSESEIVSWGVPQGSILGPLFFLVFINDLPLSLETSVTSVDLYADDTTIYDVQPNKEKLKENLQKKIFNIVR